MKEPIPFQKLNSTALCLSLTFLTPQKKTAEINQKLRANQAKQFDSLIKSFFAELKKDVITIQNLLDKDSKYLGEHKAMIKMLD